MAHKDVSGADVRLEAENGMAKLRLLDAVFQNGKLIVRYEITDYSVEVLSEAETEELRRKERENREKKKREKKRSGIFPISGWMKRKEYTAGAHLKQVY